MVSKPRASAPLRAMAFVAGAVLACGTGRMPQAADPPLRSTVSGQLVAIPAPPAAGAVVAAPPLVAISRADVVAAAQRPIAAPIAVPSTVPGAPPLARITPSQLAEATSRGPLIGREPAVTAAGAPGLVAISYAPAAPVQPRLPAAAVAPLAPLSTIPVAPSPVAAVRALPVPAIAPPAYAPIPHPPVPAPVLPARVAAAPVPVPAPPLPTPSSPMPPAAASVPPPAAPRLAASQPGPVLPPAAAVPVASPPLPAPAPAPIATRSAPPQPDPAAAGSPAPAAGKPADALTIASFNIQVFGESKLAKRQVVDVLVRVVRNFDIVAVQEVRAKSDQIIPEFVKAVNADGSRYQFVIGPRLGRTNSKEQYTFIYDSNRVELDPSSVGTMPNPGDRLHRPPMYARFRTRVNPPEAGFSFWMVDTHTDPDEVKQEVNALADVFVAMKAMRPDEDDVILLGDLNASPQEFGKIRQIPGIGWAVSGVPTNTRRSKTYDNLIFDRTATTEYTGRWGVLDLQNTFGLSIDKALEVSDHNPVWAAFSPWETQRTAGTVAQPVATR